MRTYTEKKNLSQKARSTSLAWWLSLVYRSSINEETEVQDAARQSPSTPAILSTKHCCWIAVKLNMTAGDGSSGSGMSMSAQCGILQCRRTYIQPQHNGCWESSLWFFIWHVKPFWQMGANQDNTNHSSLIMTVASATKFNRFCETLLFLSVIVVVIVGHMGHETQAVGEYWASVG